MNCDPSSFCKSDRNHACVECAFFVVEFRHYVFEVVINFELNVLSVFQRLSRASVLFHHQVLELGVLIYCLYFFRACYLTEESVRACYPLVSSSEVMDYVTWFYAAVVVVAVLIFGVCIVEEITCMPVMAEDVFRVEVAVFCFCKFRSKFCGCF